MNKRKLSVSDLCHIGIFTAIISVLAQLSIPMPTGVPMTLQTFAISLAGVVLGVKKGTLSTVAYVLLGAVGVPVFAGLSGGVNVIFGYTGGFLLSFPLLALAAGLGAAKNKIAGTAAGIVAGVVINFLCGMLMFAALTGGNLAHAFGATVLPFLPTSTIQIILAALIGIKLKEALKKSGILV